MCLCVYKRCEYGTRARGRDTVGGERVAGGHGQITEHRVLLRVSWYTRSAHAFRYIEPRQWPTIHRTCANRGNLKRDTLKFYTGIFISRGADYRRELAFTSTPNVFDRLFDE